jgi:hypothetical protein
MFFTPKVVYFQTVKGDEDFGNQKGVTKIRFRQVTKIRLPKRSKMSDNFSKVTEIRADTKHPKNEPKRHQNSIPTSSTVNFCNRISIPNANEQQLRSCAHPAYALTSVSVSLTAHKRQIRSRRSQTTRTASSALNKVTIATLNKEKFVVTLCVPSNVCPLCTALGHFCQT